MIRGHRIRSRAAAIAAPTALLLLAPIGAAAESHGFTNHREVPNNACDSDTPHTDLDDRDQAGVHQRSVDCVAHHGVAEGSDGAYLPNQEVTRAQMASFVARALEAGERSLPEDPDEHFDDADESVHADRIDQLAEIGVVEGHGDDRYDPNGPVTRAQMASFVLRATSWNHTGEVDAYAPAGDEDYFLDIAGSAHVDNIRAGHELWLYEGREPGEFAPDHDVRRGAMATSLTRMLDAVHPEASEANNQTYVVSPMEEIHAEAGAAVEFSVISSRAEYTNGDEPQPGPVRQALHIALFPCGSVDTDLPATFTDAAGDGLADDLGATDEGHAYIRDVNGEPVEAQAASVPNVSPQDGQIDFTVISDEADCTVPVVFDDRGPIDELRVDAHERPANPFGLGLASWD